MPIDKSSVNKLRSNMSQIFTDIDKKKSKQFVTAVLTIGWNESKEYAPVEYSTLVNSVRMEVDQTSSLVTGELSYNTKYAAYLENNENWKPKPVTEKAGPAWNPNATPHYLQKGFESSQSKTAIKKAQDIFRI